jgi:hypothetical protein
LSLLELRDVTLARAEEETAREVVLRIPRSERNRERLIEEAMSGQMQFATAPGGGAEPVSATVETSGAVRLAVATKQPN